MRQGRRSVCCTASSSVYSLRRAKLTIICPDLLLDYKLATHPRRGLFVRYYFRHETSWICAKSNCARRLSTRRRTKFSSILWPNWWTRTSLSISLHERTPLKDRAQLDEIGGPEYLSDL